MPIAGGWVLPLAPIVGSFLGVVIRRLPAGEPIAVARSRCDACHTPLGPAELVPIASYVIQRGRCRHCRAPIGRFHLAVELAALAVAGTVLAAGAPVWPGCILGWTLLAAGWIDAETLLLPDALTLPLLLAGLAEAWLDAPDQLIPRAAACAVAWALLAGTNALYRRLRGRDGLGGGDPRLYAAAGAWLGPAGLAPVLLVAAVLGLGWAGVARLRGARLTTTTQLPFGPALALATFLVWLAAPAPI